jgi:hypothetical protein
MSFTGSEDHFNREDSSNYAPRSVRSEASLRSSSTPQTRSVRPAPSEFDDKLQKALRQSTRHPLEPRVVYPPDEPPSLLRGASRFATAIGVSAIIAFVFFIVVPKFSRASDPPKPAASESRTMTASDGAAKITPEESQALLQKFEQFRNSQGNPAPEGSSALLEKFVQWQQRK